MVGARLGPARDAGGQLRDQPVARRRQLPDERRRSGPNAPSFDAGTLAPIAGSYSPLVVNLRRDDGSQEFSALTVTPPPGLLGKLAGIAYCPDRALTAAAAKTGAEEKASPSCPAASRSARSTSAPAPAPRPTTSRATPT